MTECTEVSYIVPSYFFLFLRCKKSSGEIIKRRFYITAVRKIPANNIMPSIIFGT
jgi:hypothetical protein